MLRSLRRQVLLGMALCAILSLIVVAPARAISSPATVAGSPAQVGTEAFARVIAVRAVIYAGPGFGFWPLGGLRQDAIVPVVGVNAEQTFWQVNTPAGVGFVSDLDVEVGNVEAVPVLDLGPIGTITTGEANVRTGPGVAAPILGTLTEGMQFFLVGLQPDGLWVQIRSQLGTGWVRTTLTDISTEAEVVEGVPETVGGPRAIAQATVNVRSGPGIAYTAIGQLGVGESAPIVGRTDDYTWLLIETPFGRGWVSEQVVTTVDYFGTAPVEDVGAEGTAPTYGAFTRTSVNLRAGPSTAFPSLGVLRHSEPLTILGQSPDGLWWFVECTLGEGWINKRVVRTTGDFSSVPVITAP